MAHRLLVLLVAATAWCLAVGGVHAQFPAGSQRAAAARRVADAQRAVAEAAATLAKAEQAVIGTEGEARKTSERLVVEARQTLEGARRELGRRNTELSNAVTRDAAAAGARAPRDVPVPNRAGLLEREHADPHDAVERFALLTPGGPVVVEVSITIDGQPFRLVRERLVDELLAAADRDRDGAATWLEALATPRFAVRQAKNLDAAQRQLLIKGLDINANGLVDRPEARRYVADQFQAPAFVLQSAPSLLRRAERVFVAGQVMAAGDQQADLHALLDGDGDGVFTAPEIAAAAERLKARDMDDNDLVDVREIIGVPLADANLPQAAMPPRRRQPVLDCVLLGPAMTDDVLYTALSQRYLVKTGAIKAEHFRSVPRLFASLDEDGDGMLQKFEISRLCVIEPQIALTVDLGYKAQGRGLGLRSLGPELVELKRSESHVSLALPGVLLALASDAAAPQRTDYGRAAGTLIARLDKDANGYLERAEMLGSIAERFEAWDGDEDGKVFAKELAAAEQAAAPRATQAIVRAVNHGSSVLQLLDQDGDSRLSLREMRSAGQRIGLLDGDRDGRVVEREITAFMSVTFSTGAGGMGGPRAGGKQPAADQPSEGISPEWFTRMDRNRDGDLSFREFLGDLDDFRRLDSDGDGLVDEQEASQAAPAR